METGEISVSAQNTWWVGYSGKYQGHADKNAFLIIFSAFYFYLFCYSTGKIQVDVFVTFGGLMQLKSRAGG